MPVKEIKKILVIRLSSLGDVIQTTPLLKVLKQQNPSSEIDFVVKAGFKEALLFNPNIRNLFIFEKENTKKLKAELKKNGYDLVIDLQNNIRSRKLTAGLTAEISRFKKPTFEKFLLVRFKINLLKELRTISQRYADAANVSIGGMKPELFLPKNSQTKLKDGLNYLGICPGSKHFTKRWPPEYFIQLANELTKSGYKVVVFGGKADSELCREISGNIPESINLQNNDELLQTAADMKKCKVILTNDSGLMHTVAALGIPLISIFGSTVREFGFFIPGAQNLVLENKSLSCRPCSHIGKSSCPQKHFKCMIEITPEFVFNQLKNFIVGL